MFFALKGPNFNANAFAADALEKGARYAVVDDPVYTKDNRCLLVDDVLTALQLLARYHRDQLSIPVIGLTGSNGKTTSKELVAAVLAKKFRTLATQGNLNNHIGVPITILSITPDIEMAVVEMGANRLGEIEQLCRIANPTHGFITNIGKAHIGTFGGFENIIRGKSELYQHLISNNGQVWINSANPILANMARRFQRPLFYPAASDYYHCELIAADPYVRLRTEEQVVVSTQLVGAYNFENVAVALCIGKYFGVPASAAQEAVATYVPSNMRSQVVRRGTNIIILDAYNANPSSMESAVTNLASMASGHTVAILGDMYELEEQTEVEHRQLGKLVNEKGIEEVLLCGAHIRAALESCPAAHYFPSRDELLAYLREHPFSQSTILVKASRGMGLEKVMDVLQ